MTGTAKMIETWASPLVKPLIAKGVLQAGEVNAAIANVASFVDEQLAAVKLHVKAPDADEPEPEVEEIRISVTKNRSGKADPDLVTEDAHNPWSRGCGRRVDGEPTKDGAVCKTCEPFAYRAAHPHETRQPTNEKLLTTQDLIDQVARWLGGIGGYKGSPSDAMTDARELAARLMR